MLLAPNCIIFCAYWRAGGGPITRLKIIVTSATCSRKKDGGQSVQKVSVYMHVPNYCHCLFNMLLLRFQDTRMYDAFANRAAYLPSCRSWHYL